MLAIRMQRNGRKGLPLYRIVVQEAQRHPLSGRIVAKVGSYNPHTKSTFLDKAAITKYLNNGAQPSTRVVWLLKKNGVKLPAWVKDLPKFQSKTKHADKLRKNQSKETPETTNTVEESPEKAVASTADVAEKAPASDQEKTA